jgi:hypothetical protein
MRIILLIFVSAASLFISGCGLSMNSSRAENPVIQDYALPSSFFNHSINVFATKASHRLALIVDDKNSKRMIMCAEPSPDVGETFASAMADSFKAKTTEPKTGLAEELSNEYQKAVATQVAPLLYRTQGLQLYRNAISSLCVDEMNSTKTNTNTNNNIILPVETSVEVSERIDPVTKNVIRNTKISYDQSSRIQLNTGSYADLRLFYFLKALEAIRAEIPLMSDAQKTYFQNVKSGIGIDQLKQLKQLTETNNSADSGSKKESSTESENSSGK